MYGYGRAVRQRSRARWWVESDGDARFGKEIEKNKNKIFLYNKGRRRREARKSLSNGHPSHNYFLENTKNTSRLCAWLLLSSVHGGMFFFFVFIMHQLLSLSLFDLYAIVASGRSWAGDGHG